jgi:hypothetical protein
MLRDEAGDRARLFQFHDPRASFGNYKTIPRTVVLRRSKNFDTLAAHTSIPTSQQSSEKRGDDAEMDVERRLMIRQLSKIVVDLT